MVGLDDDKPTVNGTDKTPKEKTLEDVRIARWHWAIARLLTTQKQNEAMEYFKGKMNMDPLLEMGFTFLVQTAWVSE